MKPSEKLAEKFLAKQNPNSAIDPASVLMYAKIIMSLVQLFKECNKSPENAVKTANKPSWWDKIRLRRQLRQKLGRDEFKKSGSEVMEVLLSGGKDVTEEDFKQLYQEV